MNSSKKENYYNLENFIFFKNIKVENNIKLLTLNKGYIEFKNISEWENVLKNSDKKYTMYCNTKTIGESSATTDANNPGESNINTNNNTNLSVHQQNKIIILLEIIYREEKMKLCKLLQNGPPNNLRWLIWIAIVRVNYKLDEKIYSELLNKHLRSNLTDQINKDLHRTAPEVTYFQSEAGMRSLFNVLKALAIHDKELAYCQGINILAANILLVSDGNELETFHFMCYLFSHENGLNLKEFYTRGFPKLHLFIYISKILIKENLRVIFNKIDEIILPDHDEIWIFKWLQSLFSLIIDFSINVRLWDCIVANGLNFIFYFILGFLKFFENDIMLAEDMVEFVCIFKNNQVINSNNNLSKIEEAGIYRDKLINLSLGFKNKINESCIDLITKRYYSDTAIVNQYLLNDSYTSSRFKETETNLGVNGANFDRKETLSFSYRVYVENIPDELI
jgi:hypothetical protein